MAVDAMTEALVVDLMATDPLFVAPDMSVAKVAEILADYDIGGLPVVDPAGRLVGVVSQTDLLRVWASSVEALDWPAIAVRDVMTTPAVTVRGSATLRQAARLMTDRDVHRLVVVGDDREAAVGVISESDVVRVLIR